MRTSDEAFPPWKELDQGGRPLLWEMRVGSGQAPAHRAVETCRDGPVRGRLPGEGFPMQQHKDTGSR